MTTQTATRPRTDAGPRVPGERPGPTAGESLAGQQLATSFLVRGCEAALFDLRCSLGAAESSREVRAGLDAIELLEVILASWREALAALHARSAQPAPRSGGATRRLEPAPS